MVKAKAEQEEFVTKFIGSLFKSKNYFYSYPVYNYEMAKTLGNYKNWVILDILKKCGSRGMTEKEIKFVLKKLYSIDLSSSEINTRLNKELMVSEISPNLVYKLKEGREEAEERIKEFEKANVSISARLTKKQQEEVKKIEDEFYFKSEKRFNRWYINTDVLNFQPSSSLYIDYINDIKEVWTYILHQIGDSIATTLKETVDKIMKNEFPLINWLPSKDKCKIHGKSHEAEEFIYSLILPVIHTIVTHILPEILNRYDWYETKKVIKADSCKNYKIDFVDEGYGLVELKEEN